MEAPHLRQLAVPITFRGIVVFDEVQAEEVGLDVICLMCIEEDVESVNWVYSYPTACTQVDYAAEVFVVLRDRTV